MSSKDESSIHAANVDELDRNAQEKLAGLESQVKEDFNTRTLPELKREPGRLVEFLDYGEKLMGGENFVLSSIASLEIKDPEFLREGAAFCERAARKEALKAQRLGNSDLQAENQKVQQYYKELAEGGDDALLAWAEKVRAEYQKAIELAQEDLNYVDDLLSQVTPEEYRDKIHHPQGTLYYAGRSLGLLMADSLSSQEGINVMGYAAIAEGFVTMPDENGRRYRLLLINMSHKVTENGVEPSVDVDKLLSTQAHEAFHGSTIPIVFRPANGSESDTGFLCDGFNPYLIVGGKMSSMSFTPTATIEEGMALSFQELHDLNDRHTRNSHERYHTARNLNNALIAKVGSFQELMGMRLRSRNSELQNLFYSLPPDVIQQYEELEVEFRKDPLILTK